jgi:hypothetical protein
MKSKLYLFAAAVSAAGLIAAGCGDDDDSDSSLSKEEFVAQANEICTEGTTELNEAAQEEFGDSGQPTPAEEEAFVRDTVVPNIQGQLDEIRELGIPEGDADEVNGILDDAQSALDELEEDPSGTSGGTDPFADVNRDLTEYGISACAG